MNWLRKQWYRMDRWLILGLICIAAVLLAPHIHGVFGFAAFMVGVAAVVFSYVWWQRKGIFRHRGETDGRRWR
jgi:membrane protein implicated in regulation of membrane protease activity